jgi:hypothetical protein
MPLLTVQGEETIMNNVMHALIRAFPGYSSNTKPTRIESPMFY